MAYFGQYINLLKEAEDWVEKIKVGDKLISKSSKIVYTVDKVNNQNIIISGDGGQINWSKNNLAFRFIPYMPTESKQTKFLLKEESYYFEKADVSKIVRIKEIQSGYLINVYKNNTDLTDKYTLERSEISEFMLELQKAGFKEKISEDYDNVVFSYSRKQAIADGMLIDITKQAKEAGFRYHTVISHGINSEISHGEGDYEGKLWDILNVLKAKARSSSDDRVYFTVKINGKNINMYSVIGPGDTRDPVMTIMLTSED